MPSRSATETFLSFRTPRYAYAEVVEAAKRVAMPVTTYARMALIERARADNARADNATAGSFVRPLGVPSPEPEA